MPKKFTRRSSACTSTSSTAPTPSNDFDAGLISPDGTKRAGYDVVQKRKSATCRA